MPRTLCNPDASDTSALAFLATTIISNECRKWTTRCDDAKRIPDALFDFAPAVIKDVIDTALRKHYQSKVD